ncbi:MAG TPA: hypothetical protein VFR86_06260, partial [Burkholderiaceae bacterium]|nr:hypothetical protein [Burkholderiaceae bacterium]
MANVYAPRRASRLSRTVRALSAALLLSTAAAQAEDIDLYAMNASAADIPNVLFVIDNSGNWNASLPSATRCNVYADGTALDSADSGSKVGIELCALFKVVTNLANSAGATAKARIGVMMFNSETGSLGAYPRIALTGVTTSTVGGLQTRIKGISSKSGYDTSNRGYWGLAMHEAYLYFKGLQPLNGAVSTKHDPAAFTAGGAYNSPASASCSRNYIIFIGNGSPNTSGVDDERTLLATVTNNLAQIGSSAAGNPEYKNWSDEYARALRNVDLSSKDGAQNIKTFSIAVTGASSDP